METIDEIILFIENISFIEKIENISFIYTEYSHDQIKLNYNLFFDFDSDFNFILKKEAYPDMFDLKYFIKSIKLFKNQNINESFYDIIKIYAKNSYNLYKYYIEDQHYISKYTKMNPTDFCNTLLTSFHKNYTESIIDLIYFYNLLDFRWDINFENKIIVIGIGDFYKQAFPNFLINDINNFNKKYEIIIIDGCLEVGFGCPSYNAIKIFINEVIHKQKISNIKITVIKLNVDNYSIYYSLINKIDEISKCIIINTIGTGHHLDDEIIDLNYFINTIKNNHFDFYQQNILTHKIIYYLATGKKFCYFDNDKENFDGFHLKKSMNCLHKKENKYCELDFFNDCDLLSNNYKEFNLQKIENKTHRIKYLKYKSKYLMLKKLFNKNN